MKRTIFAVPVVGILVGLCALNIHAQVVVGEYALAEIRSQHPYEKPGTDGPKLVFEREIFHPEATYIALHFSRFDLAPGDFVIVRSPDSTQYWEYRDQGRKGLGLDPDGFFATQIKGEIAIIELYAQGVGTGYGFDVDFYGRGYSDGELRELWDMGLGERLNLAEPGGEHRSICTADDTEEIKCYQASEPEVYEESRAVVRLLINGNAHCTGWLIGCDGHVMTNEHCIGSQSQLNSITFEFMAEGNDCSMNCGSSLACSGTIEAAGGTLIQVNAALDFALVIPDTSTANSTDLPATYGFMQLRETGPVLDEQIYIPQHPAGWGKRVAFLSSYPGDGGIARINSLNEVACSGGPGDVGYWADTQGGSSGSPVLGYADHRVVALHHCRGSAFCTSGNGSSDDPNRGVPITAVIESLGSNLPNCAICPEVAPASSLTGQNNGDNQVDLSWNPPTVDGGTLYNIYRSEEGCAGSNFELIAENVAGTTFSDTSVSGGTTYGYTVRVVEGGTMPCESADSNCVEVTATGVCLLAPTFAGVTSVTNEATAACEISVTWDSGAARCGSSVVYNLYRSTSAGFTPGPGNLLASGLTGTSYQDVEVETGMIYHYIVRAEDNSGNGSGPHAGGIEDGNTVSLSAVPTGPDAIDFEDDLESGTAQWTVAAGPQDPGNTNPWTLSTAQSHSPANAWFVTDQNSVKDQVLQMANPVVLPANPAKLNFWHRYNTENTWDGGVLEYTVDGGTTWQDILEGDGNSIPANVDRFLAGEYVGNLRASSNPLGGRAAWFGDNTAFEQVNVDLSDFAGSTINFRWRLGCDGSQGDEGWYVDDIEILIGSNCSDCNWEAQLPQWPVLTILDLMGCLPNPM